MADARVFARRLRAGVAACAILLIVIGVGASPAAAVPPPGTIEAQIDTAWRQAEPIVEQYNLVHDQLAANQAKAATLQKQLQPLQLQVDAALAKVSDISVRLYKTGPASGLNAVLTTGSPSTLVDQLGLLNQLAYVQEQQISSVATVRDKYLADKKVLDGLISQQAAQAADLAAKKSQIEAQIADLQKLRQQAYGSGGGTGALKPAPCPFEYIGGKAGIAAQTACAQIGKPYVYATAGPMTFDCSGLTEYAWKAAGVSLYHYTGTQHSQTTRIARADLRVGDLVFYYGDLSHVAIFVGGDWVVHAPEPGDDVRMAKMEAVGPINSFGRPG